MEIVECDVLTVKSGVYTLDNGNWSIQCRKKYIDKVQRLERKVHGAELKVKIECAE